MLENRVQVAVKLSHELTRIRRDEFKLLDQRANHRRNERRLNAVAGDVANKHASFGLGKRRDAEEISADRSGGEIPVSKLKGALSPETLARKNRILLRQHR